MNRRRIMFLVTLLLPAWAAAQATEFTYQGRLYNNGALVSGNGYVLRITPYAQASGGTPLVAPVDTAPLAVVDGVFSTTLDFGPTVFTGERVWLEIQVQAPSSSFVLLDPRQPVTPAPYAINADKVDGLDAAQLVGQQGPPGPQGQQGIQGPPGVQGPPGSAGVVTTVLFNGPAGSPVVNSTAVWTFFSTTANVILTGNQRLTGATSVALGTSSGVSNLDFGLCFRLGPSGTVTNFLGSAYLSTSVGTTRTTVSTAASVLIPAAGTYAVGPCYRETSGTINNNDFVNGWVIVTN